MTNVRQMSPNIHERVDELLPWFVNGTLPEGEQTLVERHLKECLTCRREFDVQRNLRAMCKDSETIPLAPHHALAALMARIDSQASPAPSMLKGVRRLVSPLPIAAAIVGVTLTVVLAVSLSGKDGRHEPVFRTLSDDAVIIEDHAPLLQLIFRDDVARAEVQNIVSRLGGRLIAGPSEIGAYTIEVVASDMDRSLEILRADSRVRFAEHARVLSARE